MDKQFSRREFIGYSAPAFVAAPTIAREAAENNWFRSKVADHYLYNGVSERNIGKIEGYLGRFGGVYGDCKAGEANMVVDLISFEEHPFYETSIEAFRSDFEDQNVNCTILERKPIDKEVYNQYENISRDILGSKSFALNALGLEGGFVQNVTPEVLYEEAIQIVKIPDYRADENKDSGSDSRFIRGKAHWDRALVCNTDNFNDPIYSELYLLKHEVGHTLGLHHSEKGVMNDENGDRTDYTENQWKYVKDRLT